MLLIQLPSEIGLFLVGNHFVLLRINIFQNSKCFLFHINREMTQEKQAHNIGKYRVIFSAKKIILLLWPFFICALVF